MPKIKYSDINFNLSIGDVKAAAAHILGLNSAKRDLTVLPDDLFIVSFPKSGNTWVRFIVANILYGDKLKVQFDNIEALIPDIYQHSDFYLLKIKSPRIFKSHEYFDPRYGNVIYIVRDPRDVVISQYHFLIKTKNIESSLDIKDFADGFLAGQTSRFGSWSENYNSWRKVKKSNLFLIRYEDLHQQGYESVRKILDFLKIDLPDSRIYDVLENSSFDRMHKLEIEQGQDWKPIRESNSDIPFVRSGKVGQWRQDLPDCVKEKFWNKWSMEMIQLGYKRY